MQFINKLILALVLIGSTTVLANAQFSQKLVGEWFEGSTSILSEQNMTTGSVSSRYGSSIGYTFQSDGTFRYAGLIKSTMYNCTTTLWNDRRGKYSVEGDVITFTLSKDYWFNSNSCSSSDSKEENKPLRTVKYNFLIGEKEGTEWLCLREVEKDDDKNIVCYPQTGK